MSEGSSRNRRQGGGRSSNRSNSNRSGNRPRRRRPAPKPTGWQKFVRTITFGLIDPFEAEQKKKRAARKRKPDSGRKPKGDGGGRRKTVVVEPTGPRLYVGNLSYDVDDDELGSAFGAAGTVVSAEVVRRGDGGRSKGFGFVEMGSLDEAKKAVQDLNDLELQGRKIFVTGAKSDKPDSEGEPRGERPRRRERDERPRSDSDSRSDRDRDRGRRRRSREDGGGGRSDRRGPRDSSGESRRVTVREVEQVSTAVVAVSKLNSEATDEDLHDLFEGIGQIARKTDAASSGRIVVEFASVEEAQNAVEKLHGKSFMGSRISVTGASEEDAASLDGASVAAPAAAAAPTEASEEPASEESAPEDPAAEEAPAETETAPAEEPEAAEEPEEVASDEAPSEPEPEPAAADESPEADATPAEEEPEPAEEPESSEATDDGAEEEEDKGSPAGA